jgi:hypothetical protein
VKNGPLGGMYKLRTCWTFWESKDVFLWPLEPFFLRHAERGLIASFYVTNTAKYFLFYFIKKRNRKRKLPLPEAKYSPPLKKRKTSPAPPPFSPNVTFFFFCDHLHSQTVLSCLFFFKLFFWFGQQNGFLSELHRVTRWHLVNDPPRLFNLALWVFVQM